MSADWPLWWQGRVWAAPPPFDPRWPAFATGCTVFETVGVRAGRAWLWPRHLARLERAARALAPDLELFDRPALEAGLAALIQARDGGDFALRINLGIGPGLWLSTRELPRIPAAGISAWLAPAELAVAAGDPGAEHKHSGRWLKERAQRLARSAGAFEALLPSSAGGFACGSRSNLYAFFEGRWWTPPRSAGALPGVVRGLLLESGLVAERPLERTQIEAAPELALSNALWLCCPVRELKGAPRELPGASGPAFRALSAGLGRLTGP
jgi:para-aminobenzoate synthetase/4-amino-4-deoxychorismate lyase